MKITFIILISLIVFAFQLKISSRNNSNRLLKKSFTYVPSGIVKNGNDTSTVKAFYISKYEVTNREYKLFLADLKKQNKTDEFNKCLPDTTKWLTKSGFFQNYCDYYFSHPAYLDYPVVCVSFEAAQKYCEWFTIQMNLKKDKSEQLIFRLPHREEFIRACRGDEHNQKFAWKENGVWNKDSSILCNHLHFPESNVAGNLSDNTDVIAPSKSYWPNQFGIYNLNGNVSEMTNLKGVSTGGSWKNKENEVQNESILNYDSPLPNVGFRLVATKIKS